MSNVYKQSLKALKIFLNYDKAETKHGCFPEGIRGFEQIFRVNDSTAKVNLCF